MKRSSLKYTDVLIIGAGPSGLMAACQLARHGINLKIIDKKAGPAGYSGALFIQARTLEIFDQMGLGEEILRIGQVPEKIVILHKGKQVFKADIDSMGEGLSKFPFVLMLKQGQTEAVLIEFLKKHKVDVNWNHELIDLKQEKENIFTVINTAGQERIAVSSRYLIGADGAGSKTGSLLKIPFTGRSDPAALFIFDGDASFRIKEDGKYVPFRNNSLYFALNGKQIAGFFPLPDNKWRIDGILGKESQDASGFRDVKERFSKELEINGSLIKNDWFSVFHSRTKLADKFSAGNCFLVGDAAHVHTPIGAQGMNTGMQDSYNLAWKLAFVIHGKMPVNFTESYEKERKPVVGKLIRSTDRLFFLIIKNKTYHRILKNFLFINFIKFLQPFSSFRMVRRKFYQSISETEISYRKFKFHRFKTGIRAGDRLPHISFRNNQNKISFLHDLTDGKKYILIYFDPNSRILKKLPPLIKELLEKHILEFEHVPFERLNKKERRRNGIKKQNCLLLRPDVYLEKVY